jgi:hypothetical protein
MIRAVDITMMLVCNVNQVARMVKYVLLVELHQWKVVWKCVIKDDGGLCVMIPGVLMMPVWLAGWLVSHGQELFNIVDTILPSIMDKELDQFGWMIWHVLAQKTHCSIALVMLLVFTTVAIMKMLV